MMLIVSLFALSQVVPYARAQPSGLVCITASATPSNCPNSSAAIAPSTIGSSLTVGVFIQGSDPMGGYDIYVKTDPSVLNPVSASLGPLIATPSLTSICINGSPTTGTCTK